MQIAHPTVHILVGIFTISLLPFMFHKTALADGLGIKISPATFRIEAKPPADIWTPFTIENQSQQPVNLTIGYKLFNKQASQNGNVVFLQNGQPFHGQDKNIFQKMQIVDDNNISHDTIDLGPQQRERFRLRILLPDNEPAGDYYFSLILLKNNSNQDQNIINYNKEDQKSSSAFQVGISSNVFLAIGDKEMPQGAITTFST